MRGCIQRYEEFKKRFLNPQRVVQRVLRKSEIDRLMDIMEEDEEENEETNENMNGQQPRPLWKRLVSDSFCTRCILMWRRR